MKHIINYQLFETLNYTNQISIRDFLEIIQIPEDKRQHIIDWWNINRKHIKIYMFPFETYQPIAGVFLSKEAIAINQKGNAPGFIRLFLALHESRHCDQHAQGIFMPGYFDTVIASDKPAFIQAYRELEKDSNDFAINSMRQIGFRQEIDREENRLRMNELVGERVYEMMTLDIEKYQPKDMFDLLKKQIGLT